MRIPDKIRLNGIDYTVQFMANVNNGEVILDGEANHNYSLININPATQDYQHQCITFLHEVCHAILNNYDCARGGTAARIPQDEETLVEMFARGFYQFLQDNGAALFDVKMGEEGKT